MGLSSDQEKIATAKIAPYFENNAIARSIEVAVDEGFYAEEFALLNKVIDSANKLLRLGNDGGESDKDLRSTYDPRFPHEELPAMFSWETRHERYYWSTHLLKTLQTINADIGPFYSNPETKPEMSPRDIFRWFLLDGYARWYAGMQTDHDVEKIFEERSRADVIVFSFCEAAVVAAENGQEDMKELVEWMLRYKWINTGPEYNLTEELCERAKEVLKK